MESPLLTAAEHYVTAFLDDLRTLVDIDSGSYTVEGIEEVAAFLRPRFQELGCEVELHQGETLGPNLVARRRGSGHGCVLLVGHMDTVFPDGEAKRRPFAIREGRAHGPGVFDMKSGLLVAQYALRLLNDAGESPYEELICVFNADEEIGSPESTPLIEELARQADIALVFEPTSRMSRVTSSRKGVGNFTLEVTGLSAHAGVEPKRGRNAILELAHRIIALQALNGTIDGVTLNVGVVQGGERPNVVPDKASVRIDIRAADEQGVRRIETALRQIADAEPVVPDTTTRLTGGMNHMPFTQSEASSRLLERANEVAHTLGFELHGEPTGGASDGNTTAALGLPTLDGMGLVGALSHNPGEYVEIDSIAPRVALLAGLLRELNERPV